MEQITEIEIDKIDNDGNTKELPSPYAGDSNDIRMLIKRRELYDQEQVLSFKTDVVAQKEETLKLRDTAFKLKELDFQNALIKYNKSLHDNNYERSNALKKAGEDRRAVEDLEKQITELRETLKICRQVEIDTTEELKSNKKYEMYLLKVVEYMRNDKAENLITLQDLLDRHDKLQQEISNLVTTKEATLCHTEQQRNYLSAVQQEQHDTHINKSNELTKLQNNLDRHRKETDNTLKRDMRGAEIGKIKVELGQINNAASNLYLRLESISARNRQPYLRDNRPTMETLELIKEYLLDFSDIVLLSSN